MLRRFDWFLKRKNLGVVKSKYFTDMRYTSGIEIVEEKPSSIPKVFLIDAYEVS
jgi:hypothetical protein